MGQPVKGFGIAESASYFPERNVRHPRCGNLIKAFTFCGAVSLEEDGATVTDFGVGDAYNAAMPPVANGSISVECETPSSEDERPFLFCSDTAVLTVIGSTVSNLTFPVSTQLIRFRDASVSSGSDRNLYQNGPSQSTDGHLRIVRLSNVHGTHPDGLGVYWRHSSTDYSLLFSVAETGAWNSTWKTLIITKGPLYGTRAYLNTLANAKTSVNGGQWIKNSSQLVRLNGTTVANSFDVSVYYLWDCELDSHEIDELLGDAHLPLRPPPSSTTVFATNFGSVTGCAVPTGATVRMVTAIGSGGNLLSDEVQFRIVHGTSRTSLNTTGDAVAVSAITDISTPLDYQIAGYTEGTTVFYRVEWRTSDSGLWLPLPGHIRRFVTQRTSGAPVAPLLWGDDHLGQSATVASQTIGVDADEEGSDKRLIAAAQAIADIRRTQTPDFIMVSGDTLYTDEAYNVDLEDGMIRAAAWVRNADGLLAMAAVYVEVGNHEGHGGYQQHSEKGTTDVALQAMGTTVWQTFVPNPTSDTYDEGGEDEGAPSTSEQAVSWQPPVTAPWTGYTGGYAGYVTDYIMTYPDDSAGIVGPSRPKRNYYAFTWGGGADKLLVIQLDVFRYTEVGDPGETPGAGTGGEHTRASATWNIGSVQSAWFANLLETTDASHILIRLHHFAGRPISPGGSGTLYYGRGSGQQLDTADDMWLIEKAAEKGAWFAKSHDHRHSLVVRSDRVIINVGTACATSLIRGTGWPGTEIDDDFGSPASRGQDTPSGGVGAGAEQGIKFTYNVPGYMWLVFADGVATLRLRHTFFGVDTAFNDPKFIERYISETLTPSASNVITHTERPKIVVGVWLDSEISNGTPGLSADNFYNDASTYFLDQQFAASTIDCSANGGVGTSEAQMLAVPEELDLTLIGNGGYLLPVPEWPSMSASSSSSASTNDDDGPIDPLGEVNPGTKTAQQVLGIPPGYGNWVTGDVRPGYDPDGRSAEDFANAKVEDPGGAASGPSYYYQDRDL